MKQTVPVILAAALLAATPALAADPAAVVNGATQFNCDFEPACEVAPGVYGSLNAPTSSKFNLAIGGFVKLDYAYNSSNFGPNGFFTNTRSPKNDSLEGQKDQSTFSARSSRIWFRSSGPALLGAKTTSLLELDFTNGPVYATNGVANTESFNATPRLRHAWANLDWGKTQVLFGQSTENFNLFNGATIDFNAGTQAGFGNGYRVPQIKVTQRVDLSGGNSLKLVAAVEQPFQTNFNTANTRIAPGNSVGAAGDSWGAQPNVVAQALFISKALGTSPIAYGFGQQNFTAGFFGLYGNQHGLGQRDDKTIDSWGVGFYTFVPVLNSSDGKKRAKTLTFEGHTYLAANVNNATAYQYTGTAGDLRPAKGFGVAGHLIYYPTDQLSVTGGFGRRQAYNYGDYSGIANFEKYNQTYFINTAYDLNAAIRVAAEYQRLDTKYGNVTVPATPTATSGRSENGDTNIARLAFYYFF